MRLFLTILSASSIVACTSDGPSKVVEARDACFAVAKSLDDVTLTTSALRVEMKRGLKNTITFNWPAKQHGNDYVCSVNASARKITSFAKNDIDLLAGVSQSMRAF